MIRSRSFWIFLGCVTVAHLILFAFVGDIVAFHLPGRSALAVFSPETLFFRSETVPAPDPRKGNLPEHRFTLPSRTSTAGLGLPAPRPPSAYAPSGIPAFPREAQPRAFRGFGQSWNTSRLVLVLDVSGSMVEAQTAGRSRYETARSEAVHLLNHLPDTAQFNIVLFAEQSITFSPALLPATPVFVREAIQFLQVPPDVGATTDLRPGMEAAFLLQPDNILLITDGFSNRSADTLPTELRYLRDRLSPAVRLHFIGVRPDPHSLDALRRLSLSLNAGFSLWETPLRSAALR
jgi:hypothetical protein